MAIAGSALIQQDHIVLVALTGGDQIGPRLGGRLPWSTSQVEDGPLVRMGTTRGDENDLQGQPAALMDPPVLEDVVDAAAQLVLDARDVAGS